MIKSKIDNQLLLSLFEKICIKNNDHFILNNDSFKKGLFLSIINPFIEEIKPFYHKSKLFYLNRKITYNNFTTILRQICNFNNISYKIITKYDKSDYQIIYLFFI